MGSQIAEKACRYIHVYEVGLKKDDTWLFYPHLSIFDPLNSIPFKLLSLGLDALYQTINSLLETFVTCLNRDTHLILINCRPNGIS